VLLTMTVLSGPPPGRLERKTCMGRDGVPIVYSAAGSGEPALVFIHGAFANRSFWDEQVKALSPRHRVVALDLPGHGESGVRRDGWGLPELGEDVRAVVENEHVASVVIFCSSLGGIAVEAALRRPGTVLGIVGVDTFEMLGYRLPAEQARHGAEDFRRDYSGSVKALAKRLFHGDAAPALVADTERRMLRTAPAIGYQVLLSAADYDLPAAVRRLTVPLLAINGDLVPTDVTNGRSIKPDFQAIVMEHTGHYPMLERPEEFDRHVRQVVAALVRHAADRAPLLLGGALQPPVRERVVLTAAQLERCAGRYEVAPGVVFSVTREGDHLLARPPDQSKLELLPSSDSEFFVTYADMRFVFELSEPGPAKALVLIQMGREARANRQE
jgi:sigma-B regulation protein RsbQ